MEKLDKFEVYHQFDGGPATGARSAIYQVTFGFIKLVYFIPEGGGMKINQSRPLQVAFPVFTRSPHIKDDKV